MRPWGHNITNSLIKVKSSVLNDTLILLGMGSNVTSCSWNKRIGWKRGELGLHGEFLRYCINKIQKETSMLRIYTFKKSLDLNRKIVFESGGESCISEMLLKQKFWFKVCSKVGFDMYWFRRSFENYRRQLIHMIILDGDLRYVGVVKFVQIRSMKKKPDLCFVNIYIGMSRVLSCPDRSPSVC